MNREKKENHDKLLKTKRINGERKKEKRETKRKIKKSTGDWRRTTNQ